MTKKKRPARPETRLIYAASETDCDLLYATGLMAPDPFLFVKHGKRIEIAVKDLELGRAQRQAHVSRVRALSRLERAVERGGGPAEPAQVIRHLLGRIRARRVKVPPSFPLALADELRSLGIQVAAAPEPFWPERELKTASEVRAITAALRAAEAGLQAGIEALRGCRIAPDGYLRREGRRFTAEELRSVVNARVMAEGAVPAHTICAPGDQAVDPHEAGHGPIRAHTPIVIDVFPRSESTGYFGDLTRTVVRGRASERLKEVYALVGEGVRLGQSRIRDGASGRLIHAEIQELFTRRGYPTGRRAGRMQGFFHGTGHGVGLEIHEAPSIGKRGGTLRAGHVVTVEPGLYYLGLGGVRIEDLVLVRQRDCRNLTQIPKSLEI
jgi:Xaa-Pro aminopeptidase